MSISLIWVVPSLPVKLIFVFDEGERLLFESSFFFPRGNYTGFAGVALDATCFHHLNAIGLIGWLVARSSLDLMFLSAGKCMVYILY